MTQFWDKQIQRADHLAKQSSGSSELLAFYAQLLRAQKEIYELLRGRKGWLPSGDLERDLSPIHYSLAAFLKTVATHGPASLAAEAHNLSETTPEAINEMLLSYWRNPRHTVFRESNSAALCTLAGRKRSYASRARTGRRRALLSVLWRQGAG